MYLILLDGFRFVFVSFGIRFKFQFLAQFPMDRLLYPIMTSLTLLLSKFVLFPYRINGFASIKTNLDLLFYCVLMILALI